MWGNKLGWTLSALLVVLTAAFVTWLDHVGRSVSARTTVSLELKNSAPIELPVAPSTVVHSMTTPGDATPIYRRAIEAYQKDPFTYGQFARAGREMEIASVPAIRILLEATTCSSGNIFTANLSEIVNFVNEKPALEALQTLATCARRAGQLIDKSKPAEAVQLYEAVFSLGAKLYQERLTYAELNAGLTMMAEGSGALGQLDANRAAACRAFDQARSDYVKQRLQPVISTISSLNQTTLELHAGDVLYFARSARDRMWRVEAIFSLGRYRYNAGKPGDQRTALKVILELCDDPDPVIRTAASAARDLTETQYRMLR